VLRAAAAAESIGVPSVSLVCDGFQRQATATGRGLGFDNMAIAVLGGHVDLVSTEEMLHAVRTQTVDEVIAGLTTSTDSTDEHTIGTEPEPNALDIVCNGTVDDINREFIRRGWTDGGAIVPPTRERVEAFLATSGDDPWRVIGTARPSGRDITMWSVAVNAVMAACDPAVLPVLRAMAEVIANPSYGVEHSGNTTGADAIVVMNGFGSAEMGFNHGPGALREGTPANTSVARWLRLYLRNVCGFRADEHDKGTFGNSARVVLAEDEAALAEIGWPPLAADFGFERGVDVVTMARINSSVLIGSVFGSTPEQIVPYLADGLVRATGWELTHVYGLGQGAYKPMLVLSPLLARVFARAGWSKADVRTALFEHARIPAVQFERYIGEWSNLTAGRRRLIDLAREGAVPAVFGESDDPMRLVPIVTSPDCFMIAVAGDPNRANAMAMSNDGPHGQWTSAAIDRSFSTDLQCIVDGSEC
jgi:hypothetical protein